MRVTRPTAFWLAIAGVAIVMLVLLREILMPFVLGMLAAYLLEPLVERLERAGINRAFAAVGIVLTLLVAFAAAILVTLPILIGEVRFLVTAFPGYIARIQTLVTEANTPWLKSIAGDDLKIEQSAINYVTARSSAWLDDLLSSLWSGGQALLSILSLMVVAPIVTIYLLIDWNRMVKALEVWFPRLESDDARKLALDIHATVAGFMRGQLIICMILAVFYATALRMVGLSHGLLIGAGAGLVSFIPFFGAASGMLISLCVAIAQFWPHWTPIVIVVLIFLAGETVADYVLSPHIIGERVKLNPVWLMFALFAFGWLFGFVGLLIAVPLGASLGVLLRFAMRHLEVPDPASRPDG
ncbi:MAG: AI-2E family transporter [Aestuariivirgaceae bacterium]